MGHSFGGKVCLAMMEEREKEYLNNNIQTWIIDSIPMISKNIVKLSAENSVESLLNVLLKMPKEFDEKKDLVNYLENKGISSMVANWMTTNAEYDDLLQKNKMVFDLDVIQKLYISYISTDFSIYLERYKPKDLIVNFIRATKNTQWTPEILNWFDNMENNNIHLHPVNSNHWVHIENPIEMRKLLKKAMEDIK